MWAQAAFRGQTCGVLQQSYHDCVLDYGFCVAIHPSGTHLVVSNFDLHTLSVHALPDMQFVATLGSFGTGRTELDCPHEICFADDGTLLIADYGNRRVQHWTFDGAWITSYATPQWPSYLALRSGVLVVASGFKKGLRVFSLESNVTLHTWPKGVSISAVSFVNTTTLALGTHDKQTVQLHALDGTFLKQLAVGFFCFCLATCADGCLLVADRENQRVRVFSSEGKELLAAPLALRAFKGKVESVVVHAANAYVIEQASNSYKMNMSVFE